MFTKKRLKKLLTNLVQGESFSIIRCYRLARNQVFQTALSDFININFLFKKIDSIIILNNSDRILTD